MRWKKSLMMWLVVALVTLGTNVRLASAGSIDLGEAMAAIQSTIVDMDYGFLNAALGRDLNETLHYSSSFDSSDWQGTLTGTHLGNAINVQYIGTMVSPEQMIWTSSGTYGSETWTGSGDVTLTDPEPFIIVDIENMELGVGTSANVGAASITAELTKDVDDKLLKGSVEVAVLKIPLANRALFLDEVSFELDQETGMYRSTNKTHYFFGLRERICVINRGDFSPSSSPGHIVQDLTCVECISLPAAAWMGLSLLGGTAAVSKLRRKLRNCPPE